jgi:GH15 family glucan-1,4-alpha-glucosidase
MTHLNTIELKRISIRVIKDNQAASGAYPASPTFSQYGYSWLRDGMWIAYSMDFAGEHESATAFHTWAGRTILRYEKQIQALLPKIDQQQLTKEADYLPTRFTLDSDLGQDEWPDFQLDGYGAWLWGAVQHCQQYNKRLWHTLRPAIHLIVKYLEALWHLPNYDCWEEFRDEIHLSTLGAIYGGLRAVQTMEPALITSGLPERIQQFALEKGVASEGHFMKFLGNPAVDASLLWLAIPFQLVPVDDPRFLRTLEKIERDILHPEGGLYRYHADTYFGGGKWLLLTCWLAWTYLERNLPEKARELLAWVEQQATSTGDMPEQTHQHPLDASYYQPWVERWGTSACPLLWSHAMYLIVLMKLEAFET